MKKVLAQLLYYGGMLLVLFSGEALVKWLEEIMSRTYRGLEVWIALKLGYYLLMFFLILFRCRRRAAVPSRETVISGLICLPVSLGLLLFRGTPLTSAMGAVSLLLILLAVADGSDALLTAVALRKQIP